MDLNAWHDLVLPGTSITYWTGHLAEDAESTDRQLASNARMARHGAWRLAQKGLVDLVQRRNGNRFDYLAIKRESRDRMPVMARILDAREERISERRKVPA